ncbi:hypothetical protein BC628DRAFT_18526 [Trametes gibbosa]|nr:hypothetical protein BC628DRAFT_18526 [Trametes gibbosa]
MRYHDAAQYGYMGPAAAAAVPRRKSPLVLLLLLQIQRGHSAMFRTGQDSGRLSRDARGVNLGSACSCLSTAWLLTASARGVRWLAAPARGAYSAVTRRSLELGEGRRAPSDGLVRGPIAHGGGPGDRIQRPAAGVARSGPCTVTQPSPRNSLRRRVLGVYYVRTLSAQHVVRTGFGRRRSFLVRSGSGTYAWR